MSGRCTRGTHDSRIAVTAVISTEQATVSNLGQRAILALAMQGGAFNLIFIELRSTSSKNVLPVFHPVVRSEWYNYAI